MRKIFYFLTLLLCLTVTFAQAQERYLDEVFTDVTVTNNVIYGVNATVLYLTVPGIEQAVPQALRMNVYEPAGDTETERPLIIYLHTGNFLPQPTFCSTTGNLEDAALKEICTRLAKRGYVVAAADYRLGWNPSATTQDERTYQLLNAAFRGIQDTRTCVRYFKKDYAEGANQYGVDTSRITVWGQGTGGYMSLSAATLDKYEDILLPKFTIDFMGIPVPMVIPQVNGDIWGTSVGIVPFGAPPPFTVGDTLCYINHPGYSSDFQLCVNMGGALADTSWLDDSDLPMISYHVTNDSFAPYKEGIVIVPTTGDLVVEVQGSYTVQQKAKELGNNAVFANIPWSDPLFAPYKVYTDRANEENDGADGLFPFIYPAIFNPQNPADSITVTAPWEWWVQSEWDTVFCDFIPGIPLNLLGLATNPFMSETQGMAYVDTIMGYFLPRACYALDLPCAINTSTKEVVSSESVGLNIMPNPATDQVQFSSMPGRPMLDILLYDLSGRLMETHLQINHNHFTVERGSLPSGMYLAKVRFEEGIVTEKVLFR
ncbi:MAG: T9SS type A sorting domain-containing protein [Saprospirales bacterium]|nr:T9SS type A sorting domain-containing protein [Saprospirales bacterium]